MKVSNTFAALVSMSLSMTACTGRSPRSVEIQNQPKPAAAQPVTREPGTPPTITPTTTKPDANGNVAADVVLTKQYLSAKIANLNLDNLTYKFKFLTVEKSEKITFDAQDKASLTIPGLPVDKPGTVSLEVLEGTVVKLRGTLDNVTLKAGVANKLPLELNPVDNGGGNNGGDTTDLTLEVSLGKNNPTPPTPPTDPIAAWDGKSNQGNSRWKIIALDPI